MSVNHEIKGQLAKLLATEDLIIENRNVPTACFDVERRVLTLPLWSRASSIVYDMLVGHEVGHALFTPNEDWTERVQVPQSYVNVVEDARIEKLMKRRYPGLRKSFAGGYKELNDQDFFCIADEDVSSFGLVDRINLHFKVGSSAFIPFNEKELNFVERVDAAETFDEVLQISLDIFNFLKEQQKEQEKEESFQNSNGQSESGMSDNTDNQSQSFQNEYDDQQPSEKEGDHSQQPSSKDDSLQEDVPNEQGKNDPTDVRTDKNLSRNIEKLNDNHMHQDYVYLQIPDIDTAVAVVKNSDVHNHIQEFYAIYLKKLEEESTKYNSPTFDPFCEVDRDYQSFKASAQKEVNYLVKEFECRKAADSYARATTARTGVLDCSKLHTYKYNEDLFKKVTTLADGKNHGLVFVLDWSGSMGNVLLDTCKQLYNLMWFCKKSNIPFDVYAFTNEWYRPEQDERGAYLPPQKMYKVENNMISVPHEFRLMHMFTHKTNASVLESQMKNVFRIASAYKNRYNSYYEVPSRLCLSGTPLNEALITLHKILPVFKKDNNLQKVQCIVLTDGEASWIPYHKMIERKSYHADGETKSFMGTAGIYGGKTYLRDKKLGTTYSIGSNSFCSLTDALLRNLSDKFTDINFIGIRLLEGRDSGAFISTYVNDTEQSMKLKEQWKKEKSVIIRSSAYKIYIGISAASLSNETDFKVNEDATKTEIKKAFVKSLGAKKLNKKVLSEFVTVIS